MKNIKLFLLLGLIVSCTPNVNNTLPSPNKTNSPSSKVSNIPSSKVSDTPSSSPKPIENNSNQNKEIQSITITDSENNILKKVLFNHFNNEIISAVLQGTSYDLLLKPNTETKIKAKVIYKDKTEDSDVIWDTIKTNGIEILSDGTLRSSGLNSYSYFRVKAKSSPEHYFNFLVGSPKVDYFCDENLKVVPINEEQKTEYSSDYSLYKGNIFPDKYISKIEYCCEDYSAGYVTGRIFDRTGIPLDDVDIELKTKGDSLERKTKTKNGYFKFGFIKSNQVTLIASKEGYVKRLINDYVVEIKSKDLSPICTNFFNFSGIHALQDEPEIVSLKVNGQQILKSSKDDEFDINKNIPKYSKPNPSQLSNSRQIQGIGNISELTGIKPDKLEVEMTFSEAVKVDDVRNYFRITSQSGFNNKDSSFSFDINYSGSEFIVSPDEKTITFKTNKPLLANKGGQEAKYLIDFSQAFRDKTDKAAIDRKYFRFSDTQINDFAIFSVKNDETAPRLLGITATNGINGANDKIELIYSEPLEVINHTSYQAGLVDPLAPKNLKRQMWYRDANDIKIDSEPVKNSIDDNNGTIFGFLSGDDTDTSKFMATYMIGRILSSELANTTAATVKLSALGAKNREMVMTPVKSGTTFNDLIRSSKIEGKNVTLEFSSDAFDSGDVVGLSVSNRITGNSVDRNRTPSINDDLYVNSKGDFINYSNLTDPAGREIDRASFGYVRIFDIGNNQNYSIVK